VFVQPLDVAFLDSRGIREHDLAKVARAIGGENIPGKSLTAQIGQIAGVVDMRVRENHAIDRRGVEVGEATVDVVRGLPIALVQPAIKQDAFAVDFQ
jgi:hypothetical protein